MTFRQFKELNINRMMDLSTPSTAVYALVEDAWNNGHLCGKEDTEKALKVVIGKDAERFFKETGIDPDKLI